jgi:hypothetical protein
MSSSRSFGASRKRPRASSPPSVSDELAGTNLLGYIMSRTATYDLEKIKDLVAAEKKPGLWQDVYHPVYRGVELYVKLQVTGAAVVISFKRK